MKADLKWLLDTNVVSEMTRDHPNAQVIEWLQNNIDHCCLSGVSVGEIEYGLHRMSDGRKKQKLQPWFEQLTSALAGRVLDTTVGTWRTYGQTRFKLQQLGRPQADLDMLIASTALTHRLTLVTRNTKHFEDTGCRLFNPWDAAQAS